MSPKSISHFAVLSILLTFSHNICSAAVSSNSVASVAESSVGKKGKRTSSKKEDFWRSQRVLGRKVTAKNAKSSEGSKQGRCRDATSSAKDSVKRVESTATSTIDVSKSPDVCPGKETLSSEPKCSSPQSTSSASSTPCFKEAQELSKRSKKEGGESLKLTNPFKVVNKTLNEDQARRARSKKELNAQPRKPLLNNGNKTKDSGRSCICSEGKEYSKKEVEDMIESLARAKRVSKRKSAREAALTKAEQSRKPRDHSVTSSLRFDKEKAATIRKNRDEKRKSQQAKLKEAPKKVSRKEVAIPVDRKSGSSDQDNSVRSNVDLYEPVHFRCDQTDWPCSSCVTKRRAHRGISVCTMVVTVLAMIISGIIIVNASDNNSTDANNPGTGGTTGAGGMGAAAIPALNF
ncbi:hypothetical protein [Chlamydiifrater phoenicopteri]|uniref:hypothetical protein n=1 Tax=Chlamydiifrater phoenicopteri TaxID=2681469 RepID=UPI001BD18BA7|nr:hypothetical protein [Chlamydiifrater phoenicopteri]